MERKYGYNTIEEAMKVYGDHVWEYKCNECGATYYGRWHSKHSLLDQCPVCDCDDKMFIYMVGPAKKKDNQTKENENKKSDDVDEGIEEAEAFKAKRAEFLNEVALAFDDIKDNIAYDKEITERVKKLIVDQCDMLYYSACAKGVGYKPDLAKEKARHIRYILYTAGPSVCNCITPNVVGDITRAILRRTKINLRQL